MALPACVNGAVFEAAWTSARSCIQKSGFCEIRNFIKPEHVTVLRNEALALRQKGFRSFETHNVYLEEGKQQSAANESAGATPLRSMSFPSSKVLVNAKQIPQRSQIHSLYQWDGIRSLLQHAFELPELYRSGDELGSYYYNMFDHGDQLGWHFDRSKFSVNLILQETKKGGDFCYWPDSRAFVDDLDARQESWEELGSKLDKELTAESSSGNLIVPKLAPGTLYLFAGNRSLHNVTAVDKTAPDDVRVNVIFTYNTAENEKLNEYTRKKFFGE